MNAELLQQLSAWLARTDIGLLELRGPGVQLRLLNDAGRVRPAPAGPGLDAPVAAVPVRAPSVGVFLPGHPLQLDALAPPGAPVAAGQVLGLLRVGALLLPVAAPCGGVVAAVHVAPGVPVGFGTHLADIVTQVPA